MRRPRGGRQEAGRRPGGGREEAGRRLGEGRGEDTIKYGRLGATADASRTTEHVIFLHARSNTTPKRRKTTV